MIDHRRHGRLVALLFGPLAAITSCADGGSDRRSTSGTTTVIDLTSPDPQDAGADATGAPEATTGAETTDPPPDLSTAPVPAATTTIGSEEATLPLGAADGLVIAEAIAEGGFMTRPSIAVLDGRFVRVQGGADGIAIAMSADGVSWNDVEHNLPAGLVQTTASHGSSLVAVTNAAPDEDADVAPHPQVWTSSDGRSWSPLPLPEPDADESPFVITEMYLEDIAVSDGLLVAVTRVIEHVDWQAYSIDVLGEDHGPARGEGGSPREWYVQFADGFELPVDLDALGVGAPYAGGSVSTWTSDGSAWAQHQQPTWMSGSQGFFELVHGPAGFATIARSETGRQQVLVSTDGARWTAHDLTGVEQFDSISLTGGPHGYFATGRDVILGSPDGIDWAPVHHFEDVDPNGSAPASAASGGAGVLVPVFDQRAARVLWSRDGVTWQQIPLSTSTFAVAAAVSHDTALVVPVELADVETLPTMPADPEELAATIAAAFVPTEPLPDPWRPWVTAEEANCIADEVIERLGVDRVREVRFGMFPWSLLGYGLSLPIEVEDADQIVGALVACSPHWELLMITSATEGTEYISEDSAMCVAGALDDTLSRKIFAIELARPYDDVPPAARPDLSHLGDIIPAYEQCLTEQELNALDWN